MPDKIIDFARQSTDEICQAMEKKNSKQLPSVIVASLTFRRYPQEKPEKDGFYAVYDLTYERINVVFWNGELWCGNQDISHFASLPEVNLDAEDFDFSTAVELMKEGYRCQPLCPKWIDETDTLYAYVIKDDDIYEVHFPSKYNDNKWSICSNPSEIPYCEINGKWRLAE